MFNLLEELRKYKAYDNKEQEHLLNIIDFLENNTNCFDRSNLEGHVTAGAFVCDKKGNILLNHHKKSGMWFQFGGHSDGDENSLNVAKREVMEEAGVEKFEVASNLIFDVARQRIPYSAKKKEPEHWHYDINFLFVVENHKFNISNESLEIKWVSIEEAKQLISEIDDGMQRMIAKYEDYLKQTSK